MELLCRKQDPEQKSLYQFNLHLVPTAARRNLYRRFLCFMRGLSVYIDEYIVICYNCNVIHKVALYGSFNKKGL